MSKKFRANGKLLIAGEYTVLDGGLAFAIPTNLGQILEVQFRNASENPTLLWEAFLRNKSLWFSVEFELSSLAILHSSDQKLAQNLQRIFQAIEKLNPNFFKTQIQNIHCQTQLEFPKDWGLGSSSTLIYLLSKWAVVDEFDLSDLTFKTSGYDIAAAEKNRPFLYQITPNRRMINELDFHPEFQDELFFVYLNQKQDTQIGVSQQYKSLPKSPKLIAEISDLVKAIIHAKTINEFEELIELHEDYLAKFMGIPKVKELYFSDYKGSVKSLGAWGGDFVLVTKREGFQDYFQAKGFDTILAFEELLLR